MANTKGSGDFSIGSREHGKDITERCFAAGHHTGTGWACDACIAQAIDEAVRQERVFLMAMDQPWPLLSVLDKLGDAVDHLLTFHGCDYEGHECFRYALNSARGLAAHIRARGAAQGEGER